MDEDQESAQGLHARSAWLAVITVLAAAMACTEGPRLSNADGDAGQSVGEAGAADAGDYYVPCCIDGKVGTCPCWTHQSCHYGLVACSDNRCVPAPLGEASSSCRDLDDGGAESDAGTWKLCCSDHRVITCEGGIPGAPSWTACAGGACFSGSGAGVCP